MRLAAQAKGGFYPTPPRVVDLAAELVAVVGVRNRQRQTMRILDPCCGAGEALAQLSDRLRERSPVSVATYGVELHRERAEHAAERLDHTMAGDLFGTSMANGAFGLLFLNPPYDHDPESRRTEHSFLTHCTRYLAEDGVLMFIVPQQRLALTARYLASHYRDLRCWAFPHPERESFNQVVLTGRRRMEPQPDQYAEQLVKEWAAEEPEVLESGSYPVCYPPLAETGDILFATRTVDPLAAVAEARRSGLWTSREVQDSLWPAGDRKTRPLMPLRRGHLAMLVAAGFLDNLVLEADGKRVLVKGRTTKELVLVEETENSEVYRERLKTTVVALDLETGTITDIAA